MKKDFIKLGAYKPEFESDNCGVGLIVDTNGKKSHKMIDDGLDMLDRMAHRGAVGYDDKTGDGAGIKIEIPHKFFKKELGEILPKKGDYAAGMFFFPMAPDIRFKFMAIIENIIKNSEMKFIKWRNVPINSEVSGSYARNTLPEIQQLFIDRNGLEKNKFRRKLYILRKKIEKDISLIESDYTKDFYISSLSDNNIIYKGLLLPSQIKKFYSDLQDTSVKTSYVILHQRYSTNTSPNWKLSHPFRYIAHNGEINTIKGNIKKFKSNKENLSSILFEDEINNLENIIEENVSDSANLDNILELLTLGGRNILHALAMLIPETWENSNRLNKDEINFYKYHSHLIEPWDGPATILFSDENFIGAKLDRNGLRPSRYYITKSNKLILASEAGVLDIDDEKILKRGKLKPGEFFAFDLKKLEILNHNKILKTLVSPSYTKINDKNKVILDKSEIKNKKLDIKEVEKKQICFGYSREEIKKVIGYMANNGKEPILSMGIDTPLALLSKNPKLIFDYFKQLFAQVTNPAIDPIREKNVMSLRVYLGKFNGLIDGIEKDKKSKFIEFNNPIIDNKKMNAIKELNNNDFRTVKIPMVFDSESKGKGLKNGLDVLCSRVKKAIENGYNLIVLSDNLINKFSSPIPSLLGLGAVNNYLIENKLKSKVDIIIESGDARDPMHIALLFGYGAKLVNPYLALNSIEYFSKKEVYIKESTEKAKENYIKALEKGLLKILSKMGISTLNSYIGAQLFESIGLNKEIIDKYFKDTPNTITGIDLDILAKEVFLRHEKAYFNNKPLEIGSEFQFKKNGVKHLFTPEVISTLQTSCQTNNYGMYKDYARLVNDQRESPITLRGLLKIKSDRKKIDINEVEPVKDILKKFVTGAMSFGSLSKEAHENLALAMNSIGASSNSGEGGEDKDRFYTEKKSNIKQVAAARFGVSIEYLNDAKEIQIKVSQGAKPGEGGHLPGKKVVGKVAEIRHAIEGLPLISPPPHHDIYSIEDLEQLIYDLKAANKEARISVKLVSRAGIGTIASGVVKGHADMILISGYDGGTGAAPISSIKNAGVPWEIGLSETHQTLLLNNLRKKVTLQVDGQMRTGRDVIIATLLGAEEYGFATAPLVVSGCIMMRKCHTNKCPVGVATQDPELRKYFKGKPEHVVNYFTFIANEIREYLAEMGYKKLEDLVGRADLLLRDKEVNHWKIDSINLSEILFKPNLPSSFGIKKIEKKEDIINKTLDDYLIDNFDDLYDKQIEIKNIDRSVGSKLSSHLIKENLNLLNEKRFEFKGTAGQSFGAFLTKNITFKINGDANDYVGKGLSGGKIVIKNPNKVKQEDILVGNTTLYGATKGKLFINGRAGERFAVRNSGGISVVEGLGNHGCEYMTNGIVVVLGEIGDNFAAGMTGGVSYIFNFNAGNDKKINLDNVSIKKLDLKDYTILKKLIKEFIDETDSIKAKKIYENWDYYSNLFIKVSSDNYDLIAKKEGLENMIKEVKNIG